MAASFFTEAIQRIRLLTDAVQLLTAKWAASFFCYQLTVTKKWTLTDDDWAIQFIRLFWQLSKNSLWKLDEKCRPFEQCERPPYPITECAILVMTWLLRLRASWKGPPLKKRFLSATCKSRIAVEFFNLLSPGETNWPVLDYLVSSCRRRAQIAWPSWSR